MTPTSIAAIFFDFDGVLVASEPLHYRCMMDAVRPHGGHIDWSEYNRTLTGQSDHSAANMLLTLTGVTITEQEIQQVVSAKREAFHKAFLDELSVPDDIVTWIHNTPLDLYLGVVSSSCASEVEPLLRKSAVHSRFDVFVFGDQVNQHKPHPEPYLTALAHVNAMSATQIDASQCLVVEDSQPGIAAGEAAGMNVRAVSTHHEVVAALEAAYSEISI